MNNFTTGEQPCQAFVEKDELFGHNLHECFGPYESPPEDKPRCASFVSACQTCSLDHHAGGWDTCPALAE